LILITRLYGTAPPKPGGKGEVAAEYLKKFKGEQGVLFIGKAQEKSSSTFAGVATISGVVITSNS
jgi:hypothetical protein